MKEDIIRMAREVGFKPHHNPEMWGITIASDEAIERFFHAAYAAGAAAEREAILSMLKGIDRCESDDRDGWWEMSVDAKWGARLLATIRARGNA